MYDVLGADFGKIGTVENPSSVNYSVYWQDIGGVTLIAAVTPKNLEMLVNDRYIVVNDPIRRGLENETVYLICNVSVNEEQAQITVNGKTVDFLLHGRAMQPIVLAETRAKNAIVQIISDNIRGLPFTTGTIGDLTDTEIIRYPLDGGAVDDMSTELMQYCGIGKRVRFTGAGFAYIADSGRDLTGLTHVPVFGRGSGTARNPTIAIDTSDYCNVATGTLTYNDDHSETIDVGATDAAGTSRRELYCGEIMQETDETEADFLARARAEMEGMLAEHIKRISVSADIDATDLAALYQLGDIVRVKIGGITIAKRVTGISWLRDQLTDKATMQLGDPIMTVIAEIKEKKPTSTAVSGQIGGLRARASDTEKKVSVIQQDYKSLLAKVDGVEAGMSAYVLNKTFEDYKMGVARLFAALEEADAALELKVESNKEEIDGQIQEIETAQAALTTRVSGAETALEMQSQSIDGLESASAKLSARTDAAEASIQLQAEKINGVSKSVVEISADVVELQGKVKIDGTVKVENGVFNAEDISCNGDIDADGSIYAQGGLSCQRGPLRIGGRQFDPIEVTSTTGPVIVLGIA